MSNVQDLLRSLGENLLAGGEEEMRRLTEQALQAGALPQQILEQGMRPAMDALGDRFSRGQAYLPELLLAAETMKAGLEVLEPAIARGGVVPTATLLLGTVEGDIHDIGKNLVKMMCQGSGFRVVDLHTNVPKDRFLEAYLRERPDLVGLSALLTSTMGEMAEVIHRIRAHDPHARFIVGGAPIRQEFADRIGADGYAPDAGAAVKVARRLVGK